MKEAAASFTLEMRLAVPDTWVRASPSTSRNSTAARSSAVTVGVSMVASSVTDAPSAALSSADWAAAMSKEAPTCSGRMVSVAAS